MENLTISVTKSLLCTGGAALTTYLLHRKWCSYKKEAENKSKRPSRLVVITGCDSGLGLSMALWASQMGYNVLAGCLNGEGEGVKILRTSGKAITVAQLDLTCVDSIRIFREECERLLKNTETKLWAVISNAAVLVCGEFLWQTEEQWHRQMNVNFWGAVNLTKEFKQLLFHYQSRLIIISSDCSKLSFPGLSIYAASKSALEGWCRSLRLEVAKYGVTVVSYQPGSFPFSSQIFANNKPNFEQMEAKMSQQDAMFYGNYFQSWKQIKCKVSERSQSIKPLESKRHKHDLQHLLEKEIKCTPMLEYVTLVQRILISGEAYLPRKLSDKMLNFVMDSGAVPFNSSTNYLLTKN